MLAIIRSLLTMPPSTVSSPVVRQSYCWFSYAVCTLH